MIRTAHGLILVVTVLSLLFFGTLVRVFFAFNEIAVINASLHTQALQLEYLNRVSSELKSMVDMMRGGVGVQRLAPDTLNLADNALLAIRYYVYNFGPKLPYWSAQLMNPTPYFELYFHSINEAYLSGAAALRSLALLRNMIGGEFGNETEEAYKNLMLDYIDEVGLREFVGSTADGGLGTLINYYVGTKDEQMCRLIEDAVEEIKNDAEYHEAEEGGYITSSLEEGETPYAIIGDLVSWYEVTGDKSALNFAGNMTNWFLYHSNYINYDGSFNLTTQHLEDGTDYDWAKHVHKTTMATVGVVKCGIATGNRDLIEWGKRIFDYVWGFSGGIGWIPENLNNDYGCETCCVRDMVILAILLAENGYPEYWNIVERMARNQLVENQLQNISWISRATVVPEDTEMRSYFDIADRVLGCWGGWTDPNDWVGQRAREQDNSQTMDCCLIGGEALYAVWHNIVTKNETGVYINLSLNRDSKLVLVNSYMPYEGKVELLIHDAPTLYVRVPDWANKTQVSATVDDNPVSFEWKGEYVKLTGLNPEQKVTVTYPLREIVEKVRIGGINRHTYTLTWRGDTVVELSPKGDICPLYQREYFKQDKAPMKLVFYNIPIKEISYPTMGE